MSSRVQSRPETLGGPFWRLFTSSTVSNLADGAVGAALPLLAAALTRDPVLVSGLATVQFLPWLLLAIPSGALVDRINRRTAMAVANTVRCLGLAGVATAAALGVASIPVLYAVAFLLGAAETVYDNAARAMLPAVVGRSGLERGNSLLTVGESVGNLFLGAPIGALLFALAIALPLWSAAGAYLLAAGLVLTVAGSFRPQRSGDSTMLQDIGTGLRWLAGHRILRSLLAVTSCTGFVHAMANGVVVLYVLEQLGIGEAGFGLMLACTGGAAILGALLSPRLTARVGRPAAMGGAEIVGAAALCLAGLWIHPVVGVACSAVVGMAISSFNVQIMSVRQAITPEAMFGRVQGAYRTVLWGMMPLGFLTGGVLARSITVPGVYILAGSLGIVAGLAGWLVLRHFDGEISAAFADTAAEPR